MIYHKVYKVPVWVHLADMNDKKRAVVTAGLEQAGAREQKWLGADFYQHLQTYANQGWASYLKPGVPLPTELIQRAAAEYVRKNISPNSQIAVPYDADRWDRVIDTPERGQLFFNAVLNKQEDIFLSHMFQIANYTEGLQKRYKVFYTSGNVLKDVLTRLSDRVITIGDGNENDLDLTAEKKKDDIEAALNLYFEANPIK